MQKSAQRLFPSFLLRMARSVAATIRWWQGRYAAPAPPFIKRAVLLRNSLAGAVWIESGTYLGDTAAFLAGMGHAVVTIEPDRLLHEQAVMRFRDSNRVRPVHGLSEKVLPGLLAEMTGPVCFWLDGHFSAGVTFQGPKNTPILEELACVEANLKRLRPAVVLVDDVRCFGVEPGYPSLDALVQWATENGLRWHIEHDIFVARSGVSKESQTSPTA